MRNILLASLLLLAVLAWPAAAAPPITGLWDATVSEGNVEIPFRFEIAAAPAGGSAVRGFFFEGDRQVGSTSGTFVNGALHLDYDFLNSSLEATLVGDELRGQYIDHYGGPAMEFRARKFVTPRAEAAASAPQVAGNWEMRRVPAEQTAPRDSRTWHLYLRQSGAEVSGAILRVDGDTGTLTGRWQNGTLVLSHFTGERPLLFEARFGPDGKQLAITLDRGAHYTGVRTGEARSAGIPEPPDPSRYTSVTDPTQPFHFRFPDLNGKIVSDADARFHNKVILLAIGGSWCPNCLDEAPFLVDLYKKFHAQGLEIVGLFFEADPEPQLAAPHVLPFVKRYAIPYPMLVAGTPDQIKQKLPQLVNFGAYPTSIYLGRDGRVRGVHAGFASLATGEEHTRLTAEITALIQRLLMENAQGAPQASAASAP